MNTRVFDTLARYGGEEFVILMPGTGEDEAQAAAERLRAAVEGVTFRPRQRDRAQNCPSASAWHAAASMRPTPNRLLQAADTALYTAKQLGRNRVEIAQPLSQTQSAT